MRYGASLPLLDSWPGFTDLPKRNMPTAGCRLREPVRDSQRPFAAGIIHLHPLLLK